MCEIDTEKQSDFDMFAESVVEENTIHHQSYVEISTEMAVDPIEMIFESKTLIKILQYFLIFE